MRALKALVIAAVLIGVVMAGEVDSDMEMERPPRQGKKLVSPRVLKSTLMMPKHRIITVPKGDPRAREPVASTVLKAATGQTCTGLSGQCIARAACTTGTIVFGLCPGSNYCCTPKPATPVTPQPPIDVGQCPVYANLATTTKAGNAGISYQTVPIASQHMVDPSKIGLPDNLADNTIRLQPTGCAFARMAEEAAKAGVNLKIASGFRSYARQQYFYDCYKTGKCNNGNLAAKPGNSNHGTGVALDINTDCGKQPSGAFPAPSACKNSKVYMWLLANGQRHGFVRAVPTEPWHWEYRAGTAMPNYAKF